MRIFPEVTDELVARYDVEGPRYTSYPTAPEWSAAFTAVDYARKLEEAGARGPDVPLSLYLHLPFCRRMCAFCACNVVVGRSAAQADEYIDHLERELDLACARLGERRKVAQLHYGGGTPTYLDEAQLARLWDAIAARFSPLPGAELAVEVNPVVTTAGQVALLARQGFNRISMGVQDFDPEVQQAIGRVQSFEQTRALMHEARARGFSGVNLDLVYGLPRQRPDTWRRTLEQVLALAPDRVALYSFAYIPDLRHHQRLIRRDWLPAPRDKLGLFAAAYQAFAQAGYRPIGMDHFARPDDELALAQAEGRLGRNFQGYTVAAAEDVVAFGATAISDVQGAYAQNARPLPGYYRAVRAGRFATARGVHLSEDDRRRRRVINALMCHFRVDLGEHAGRYAEDLAALAPLESEGLVRRDGAVVTLTPLGRVFVRNVAMAFDARLRATPRRFSRTV